MTEQDDGNYAYENPESVDFSFEIPQVSCDQYDELYNDFSEYHQKTTNI